MKTYLVFILLGIIPAFFKPGEPVPDVDIIIEQEGYSSPVAFQKTGDNGKATFSNLSRGVYRIKIILPQQSGKLIKGKNDIDCQLVAGYHNDKHEYYIRGDEGFFTVDYSKLKKVANKNITPVYNQGNDQPGKVIEVGKFEVTGNNGSISMEFNAQKPKTFEKMVSHIRDDAGMVTIKTLF